MDLITKECLNATGAEVKLIQVEASCYPHAEAGDLLELQTGDEFVGEGVYAMQFVRPDGNDWSGLRQVRKIGAALEIKEGRGWVQVTEEFQNVVRLLGKVRRVLVSNMQFAASEQRARVAFSH